MGTPSLTDGTYTCVISGLTNGTPYTYNVTAAGSGTYCGAEDNTAATGTAIPNVYYTVTWNCNGSTYSTGVNAGNTTVASGLKIASMPTAPADNTLSCGNKFMGWSETNLGSTLGQSEPGDLFSDVAGSPVITKNTTFYAVFATSTGSTVTDNLTYSLIGVTGTSYTSWSNKTATTDAKYAGTSAGGNSAIQLRTKNSEEGIVSTTSGGTLSKVTVVWNSNTAEGRTIDIYGKNTAYSSASNLYSAGTQGTKLGSITEGTSTELNITGSYTYIGIRSSSDPLYLDNVYITYGSISYKDYVTSCCATPAVTGLTYTATTTAVTLKWTKPADISGITKYQIVDDNDNVVQDNISSSATASSQITGLTTCNEYKYKVVSVGSSCNSATAFITCIPSSGTIVNFDYGGNGQANTSDKTGCGKTQVTLPTPAAWSHHTFNGWYSAATGGTKRGDAGDSWTPSGSSVTLYAQWTEDPKYTVTWTVNGAAADIADEEGKTWVYTGNNITALPTAPDGSTACDDGKVFVGWTSDAAISEETDTRPTVLFSSIVAAPAITGNVTYRAVFATSNGGSGDYKLVKSTLGEDWAGQYLIAYSSTIFANGESSGTDGLGAQNSSANPGSNLSGETVAGAWGDGVAVTLEEISEGSNTYLLKTQDGDYNYYTSNSTNGLSSTSTRATAAEYPITVTFTSSSDVKLKLGGAAAGSVFRYNTGGYFRFYKNGGQNAVYLYKKQTGGYKGYITDCSKAFTVSFSINGVIDPANNLTETAEGAGVLRSAFPTVAPATNPTGWTFSHWAETANGTTAVATSGSPAKYFPSKNLTLYAVWKKTVDGVTTYRSEVCTTSLTGLTLNDPANVKAKRADLSWTSVANATSYLLEYSSDNGSTWKSQTVAATSLTVTGLTDNTAYKWRVTALPATGSQYCEITEDGTNFTTAPYVPGTVNLIPGSSGTCAVSSLTGEEVVLPSATPKCDELTFVGWTTTDGWNNQKTGTAQPTPFYAAGDKLLTEDIDEIYAVYRTGDAGGGNYAEITSLAGLTEGKKIIIVGAKTYNNMAMKQYQSGVYIPNTEVTLDGSQITAASVASSGAAVWTVGKVTSGGNTYYTFKDQSNRYLATTNTTSSNYLQALADATDELGQWEVTYLNSTDKFEFKNHGKNERDYLRYNDDADRFNCYSSSSVLTPGTLRLYYQTESAKYLHFTNTCTECTSTASLAKERVTAIMNAANELIDNPNPLVNPNSTAQTWTSSNPGIVEITNASTGKMRLKAEGDVVITVTQPVDASDPSNVKCKVNLSYQLHVKEPSFDVVDWEKNKLVVESDIELDLDNPDPSKRTTIVAGEMSVVRTNIATDLFFSKYFEASANVKLLGVYNGTLEAINLDNYRIHIYKNDEKTSHDILFSEYSHVPGELDVSEELILYSSQRATNGNDEAILSCAEDLVDMSGWYSIPESGSYTYYPTASGVIFGGSDVITLQKNTAEPGETPVWTTIDIIGSTYANGKIDDRKIVSPSGWRDGDGWVATGTDYETGASLQLSTNRCLLIRHLDVTSGANAVAQNMTDADNGFATLGTEWSGKQVSKSSANASSCSAFSIVGGFDYATFHDQFTLAEGTTVEVRDNGTYAINFNNTSSTYLYDKRCSSLNVSLVQNGEIKLQKNYSIPIIVVDDKSTNNTMFMSKTTAACQKCDIVVRASDEFNPSDAGKLTTVSGGRNQFRSVEVYEGGKLVVASGQPLTLNSLRLRAFNDEASKMPQVTLNAALTLNDNVVYMDRRMDDSKYNWISFPYDVNLSEVTYSDGEPAVLGTNYYLKYYNGKKRADDFNSTGWYSQSTYWTTVSSEVLKAGQGYLLAIPDESNHKHRREIRFPMSITNIKAAEDANKTVPVTAAEITDADYKNNEGWNLIGNPYLQRYTAQNDNSLLTGAWEKILENGIWYGNWQLTGNTSVPYTTTWNGTTYTQSLVQGTTLQPFTSFFVQIAGNSATSLAFDQSKRTAWQAPRYAPESDESDGEPVIYAGITLENENSRNADNTSLAINDKFTDRYEVGGDLEKMLSNVDVDVYTLSGSDRRAFNAVTAERAASAVPVGYRTMNAGEHTFTVNSDYDLSNIEGIYLYDTQERIETNLLYSDYTFTSKREQNHNRFSVRVALRKKMPTDDRSKLFENMWVYSEGNDIVVCGMPEDAEIYVYDMSGKLMARSEAVSAAMRFTLPQPGVYNLRVTSSQGNETIKAIVR